MKIGRLSLIFLPALLAIPVVARADPFDDAMRASNEGRYGEAAAAFHGLAMAGDPVAAYNLALLFATGRGIPQNDTEALYWAWRARLADVRTASALLERLWPDPDPARRRIVADRLEKDFRPLAETGNGAAMLQLAAVLTVVREVADPQEAYTWQSIAAALDVPGAAVARDATLATFPSSEHAKVQDKALIAFQDWCQRRVSGMPLSCTVVFAVGTDEAENG